MGWMSDAPHPSRKGLLHRELGVPQGERIPADTLAKAARSVAGKSSGFASRVRYAVNARRITGRSQPRR